MNFPMTAALKRGYKWETNYQRLKLADNYPTRQSLAIFEQSCLFFSALVIRIHLTSGNFDLTHWKLALPDARATEIFPTALTAGFTNENFYTDANGAMVFWCPVTGGTTHGTTFPRSELREMLDPRKNQINWTGSGTNILDAQCEVLAVPSSGKVIIGQIHAYNGNAYPLIKLQYNQGEIQKTDLTF
jgi:hypothetical protein